MVVMFFLAVGSMIARCLNKDDDDVDDVVDTNVVGDAGDDHIDAAETE
jgi:hypothetical protein